MQELPKRQGSLTAWLLWSIVTGIGLLLTFAIIDVLLRSGLVSTIIYLDIQNLPYHVSIIGITCGLMLGVIQWRLLHHQVRYAALWVWVSPLALGIGLYYGVAIALAGHAGLVAAWMIAGVIFVAVTGFALILLHASSR